MVHNEPHSELDFLGMAHVLTTCSAGDPPAAQARERSRSRRTAEQRHELALSDERLSSDPSSGKLRVGTIAQSGDAADKRRRPRGLAF